MKKLTIISILSILLVGCSLTLPVTGSTEDGSEVFTGSATGYIDRSGTISLTSNKGTVVHGEFVYINSRQGEGVFRCTDGRTGPFTFVSTGRRGNGRGRLGNQYFTFTFGE